MPNTMTANQPITRNRVCTKPGTVQCDAAGLSGSMWRILRKVLVWVAWVTVGYEDVMMLFRSVCDVVYWRV